MEYFRPYITLMVACLCVAVDAQKNAHFTTYSIRYRYVANQDGIFLTEAASNSTSSTLSNIIAGVNLWNSELYASRNQDGTGIKMVLSQQLLNREQTSRILRPGETLRFSTPLNINLNALSSFPYLCMKLSKHPSARPPYQFIAGRNNFLLHCRSVITETQSLQANNPSRNSVDFRSYRVRYEYEIQPATTTNPQSVYIRSVQITAQAAPTSINFSGVNAWQAKLFVAEREDGTGPRIILSNQLLNVNQASTSVFPGKTLTFTSNQRYNLDRYGPGTSFPYLCTEFTTTPAANVEFRFGNSRSAVYCGIITTETQSPQANNPSRNSVDFRSYRVRYEYEIQPATTTNPQTVHIRSVQITAQAAPTSINFSGVNAWQAKLFVAERQDGTGPRIVLSNQLLNVNQASTSVFPGKTLTFTSDQRYNLDRYGPGTSFPYLCTEFTTTPAANVEVRFGNSRSAVYCGIITTGAIESTESQAEVNTYNADISFARANPNSNTAVANIVYIVHFGDSSSTITGDALWQLRLYASENADGTGAYRLLSEQLLDRNQISTSVEPGGQLRFEINPVFQLDGLGPGTNFPYMCLAFNKHPLAVVEVNYRGSSVLTSCEPIPRYSQNNAHFTTYSIRYRYAANEDGIFLTEAASNSTSSPLSNIIAGVNLWSSELYASQNQDGSGIKMVLSRQLLNREQTSRILRPGETLRFSTPLNINLNVLSSFPYLCLKLSKHPSARPPYQFIAGRNNFLLLCESVTAETQSLQANNLSRNSVDFRSYRVRYEYEIQPATTTNPQSVHIRSVQITAQAAPTSINFSGVNAWQAKLFVAEREDGTGPRIVLSNQLLNVNQASTSVFPGKTLTFTSNQRYNLDRYGPGTSFPYLCTEFTTTPAANVEVRFGNSRSAVYCGIITTGAIESTESQAEVNTYNADISFARAEPNSNTAVANIVYIVHFGDSSSTITGDALWQLRLYASENADGTGAYRLLSEQLLDRNQISTSVEPGGQLRFEINPVFQLEGLGPGTNLPYMCLAFNKHPQAVVEVNYRGSSVLTSCEPIPIYSQNNAHFTTYSIRYRYAANEDGIFLTEAASNSTSSPLSNIIAGVNLWSSELYASQNQDGSGIKMVLSRQLLNREQTSRILRPGETLRFSTPLNINLNVLSSFPYLCMKLSKHPSARPPYQFIAGRNNFLLLCESVTAETQSLQANNLSRNSVDFRSYRVRYEYEIQPATTTNPQSVHIRSVQITAQAAPTSINFSGVNAWQAKLFVAEREDGTGPRIVLSNQLLNVNQASTSVFPGKTLTFTSNQRYNLDRYGPGTSFPYLCTEFTKTPAANVEVLFGNSRSAVYCGIITTGAIESTESQAEVNMYDADISFARAEPNSNTAVANIVYIVHFGDSSSTITGDALWQLRLYASENADGTGAYRLLSEQLLDRNQISTSVEPGGQLRFEINPVFQLEGLGPGTNLPYMCLAFNKHPEAVVEVNYRGSSVLTSCEPIPRSIIERTSRAVVRQSIANILFIRTDPSSANVTTNVNYDVIFDTSSDVIDGNPLWQLRMFASQSSDGTGPVRIISRQLLDENQVSTGVRPNGLLRFTTSESFDFREFGPGTLLPYICLSLEKHPSADFELVFGDTNVITACKELPQLAEQTLRAVVRQHISEISFNRIRTDPFSPNVDAIVNYMVAFDSSSDVIDGNPLWQLKMFASQNIDGTGRRRTLSMQLLDENQVSAGVRPGRHLHFTTSESVDIRGLGTGTSIPYICLSLQKHPNADFEIVFENENIVTKCRELRQSEVMSPIDQRLPARAIVSDQNTQMTFNRTDPSNTRATVNINMDVGFDDASDDIDGQMLWQLRLFASQFDDGTGERQLISAQLLDREKMSIGIRPGSRLLIEGMESFDTTNLGPGTQLPHICVALNQHPRAHFQLVNGESNVVTTCEPVPLFQAPETEETKTCRLWGDPHQKTFDGYGYSFQGEAEYIAVKTCKDNDDNLPEFQIIAENYRRRPSKPVTYIRKLKVEYNGAVYELIHPNTVLVDGVVVTLPFSDGNGVNIHIAPPHKILTTNFGLVMRLDDDHNGDITLPVRFANRVCGICGNFDGIRGNECHYQDGTSMEQRNEECKESFIQQWLHNTTDLPYREHIKPLTQCDEGSALHATANDDCSILTDPAGPLAACHPFVNPDFYYKTCVFDLCQLLPSTLLLCGHVEAYILECSQVTGGTVEVEYWRDVTEECEYNCGDGMTFALRGNPCPLTCANPDGTEEDCPFPFLETCQCDEGTVLDGTRCVNVTECGCQMKDGRYLSIGEEFMSLDCSESCLCTENRELNCTSVTCAAYSECTIKSGKRDCYCQMGYTGYGREECVEAVKICRIYGDPHFSTFDQDFYSFQGDCAYTAVRTCKALQRGVFPFQIYIRNDALVPEESYTYTTLVRLHFRGNIYRIRYTGEVTVDGVNIVNSLPFRDTNTGVDITKYKNSILLYTDAGLHINLTSDTELTIKLPPVYFGKVCGLCGNADGNSTNDKQLPDGTLGKKLPFANSWSIGSCTPMDEPVESCVVGSDVEATAIDICSDIVRKDGPFAYCYDFSDPTHFYESCVFDLCATLPSTELFCVSAHQYLQSCVENGGSVQEDWKKDVEYCSSVTCPEGYTLFKDSCYRYYRTRNSYEQSKLFCSRRGGHLATVTSRVENDFISDLAEETSSWIGAERNHSASFKTYTSYGNDSYTFLPKRIPRGVGSIRFGVVAQSSAYIILSPTRNPDENTPLYEFAIGPIRNKKSSIRRCMSCPEEDSERRSLLKKGQEKRFFINFHEGIIMMGRYSIRDIILQYRDEDPIDVRYIAFKTVGSESTWNFYDNEFMWITNETWSYDNYRFGEPSNFNNEEHCLETNFGSNPGIWNDHFCSQKKSFVCEVKGE